MLLSEIHQQRINVILLRGDMNKDSWLKCAEYLTTLQTMEVDLLGYMEISEWDASKFLRYHVQIANVESSGAQERHPEHESQDVESLIFPELTKLIIALPTCKIRARRAWKALEQSLVRRAALGKRLKTVIIRVRETVSVMLL